MIKRGAASSGVEIVVDRLGKLATGMKALAKQDVLVGVPAEDAARKPEPGEPAGFTNAAIGYLNEFGSPAQKIPARPHLFPGIKDAQPRITTELGAAVSAALVGDVAEISQRLERAGIIAQASVRRRIITGPFVPLKDSTIAARKRRGHEGEAPLQDSGQYRQSINYVVRK